MLAVFTKFSLHSKLLVLVGLFVTGLLGFGFFSSATLNLAKVNGPLYQQIIRDKDLLADVLPPPAFIIETYLVAHQMRDAKDAAQLEPLLKQYSQLKQDYNKRLEAWKDSLDKGSVRDEMIEKSRPPADEFFDPSGNSVGLIYLHDFCELDDAGS